MSQFETGGINPYFHSREEISQKIAAEFPKGFPYGEVREIRFFGAGCAGEEQSRMITGALGEQFANADIHTGSDLLGAAIALCGDRPGIACILGTGSNSCYYDGNAIVAQVASGGYILGDEGGGSYIGKKLLAAFLRNELPAGWAEQLRTEYSLTPEDVLRKVYREKEPNRFLASFVQFLSRHADEPYCRQLVGSAFGDFFSAHLSKYESLRTVPVHFTGSVAFHFLPVMKELLEKNGCILGQAVRQPVDGLIRYYQQKNLTEE